jgi:hypothetical protein
MASWVRCRGQANGECTEKIATGGEQVSDASSGRKVDHDGGESDPRSTHLSVC